jgi:transcriptional regulator with XRE-family HTH domain
MATADCDHLRDQDHEHDRGRRLHQDALRFGGDEQRYRLDPERRAPEHRVAERRVAEHHNREDRDTARTGSGNAQPADMPVATPLHRIAEVRQLQGVTLRNVARRLGISLPVVRRQEQSDCDLRLSDLHRWQQVLDVPVAELLVEGEGQLSGPVLERSRMVKLMKTAAALRERTVGPEATRLVQMLIDQILEIMPELSDVSPWPNPQPRRAGDDGGRGPRLVVAEDVFRQRS